MHLVDDSSRRPEMPARRRIPLWLKGFAVLAALVALAATNMRAAAREHRAARLVSDRVSASVVVTVDAASERPGSVLLTISVSNTGPVLQLRAPRVESPGYRLEPIGPIPQRVAAGETVLVTVRLRGSCRRADDIPPRVVARVVPPSGRLHEVSAGISPDLAAVLCLDSPDRAVERQVTSAP